MQPYISNSLPQSFPQQAFISPEIIGICSFPAATSKISILANIFSSILQLFASFFVAVIFLYIIFGNEFYNEEWCPYIHCEKLPSSICKCDEPSKSTETQIIHVLPTTKSVVLHFQPVEDSVFVSVSSSVENTIQKNVCENAKISEAKPMSLSAEDIKSDKV